ncbi:unnamed protein product [Ophioblennius macclurei]
MDCEASSDVFFLPDEKFDFNELLSPCSTADEDEDEVFVGPVSHKERCVSNRMVSRLQGSDDGDSWSSWSPLTEEQLEAVCQEANKVVDQLQSHEPNDGDTNTEEFIQDSEVKLGMLDPASRVLSPVKRETFCVQDSPMKQLPPAIQRQMLRGSSSTRATRASSAASSSTRLSASQASPRDVAKAPARLAQRGKAVLGGAVVLPNRLSSLPGSSSANKGRTERTRLQPPSKVACGLKRSPSSRRSTRSQSCEDLLSDTASVTSDHSDSSVSSCTSGKRVLAPPTKTAGVRSVSGGKAPPLQNRRNTSSSSSSVSSFNSSTSLSPATGKVGSSLNCSLSGSAGPAPSNICRAANQSRTRRSIAEPLRPAASRRSMSTRARLPEAECVKTTRRSLLKRADSTPTQPTPSKRPAERPASSRLQGALKATALPTPGLGGRATPHTVDVSGVPRPKRLMSLSGMDSLPQKPSAGPQTPSTGGCTSLQMKARRPSALPTPVRRRASAIPSPCSTNSIRTPRLAALSTSDLSSVQKQCSFSPAPKPVQEKEPADMPDIIQPFCLDEEEEKAPPSPPASRPHQPQQLESPDLSEPSREEPEPDSNAMEVQTPGESSDKMEVLLLDLPAPTPQPREKLLIDLVNTPDLIRTNGKTVSAAQLIDLSSPLIKWSPEEKRENTAPLINLSF